MATMPKTSSAMIEIVAPTPRPDTAILLMVAAHSDGLVASIAQAVVTTVTRTNTLTKH